MNKSTKVVLFLLGFGSVNVFAQSNTVAAGSDASSVTGSFSYSIGQVDYISASNGTQEVNQGIQQPYEFEVLTSAVLNSELQDVKVFQGAEKDFVVIKTGANCKECFYELMDISGRLIIQKKVENERDEIYIGSIMQGAYLLNVYLNQSKTAVKTFKVVKN
jgi:hypothetical protein